MWICPECRQLQDTRGETCARDGSPLAEVFAHQTKARYPLLGRVVGDRYHLIGGLGQGGLGTVYLGQHRHLGQLFAVKFLDLQTIGAGVDLDDATRVGYRKDFLREAQVASVVRHPSVVRVSDFGEYEGLPFLVMEYVPGPSLLQMLGAKGRFPLPEAIAIIRRIALALDAFHERRLVHRDLKPANVILDPRGDGRLTLVDLGLVKDLSGASAKSSTHPLALRGTPGYLAPEQVPPWVLAQQGLKGTAEKLAVDARVDLYALGVIFYEVITGMSPFPEGSNTQVIVWACTRDPVPFSEVVPPARVPAAIEDLVMDTMNRDPARRPDSARDFLIRLDRATLGEPLQTSWPSVSMSAVAGDSGPSPGARPPASDRPSASDRPPGGGGVSAADSIELAASGVARSRGHKADDADEPPDESLDATEVFEDEALQLAAPVRAIRRPAVSTADQTLDADAPGLDGLDDLDDLDDLEIKTEVERVSPALLGRGVPAARPPASAAAKPPTERPVAVFHPTPLTPPTLASDAVVPSSRRPRWRFALIGAAAAIACGVGWQMANVADEAGGAWNGDAEVVRVGSPEGTSPDRAASRQVPPEVSRAAPPPMEAPAAPSVQSAAPASPSSAKPGVTRVPLTAPGTAPASATSIRKRVSESPEQFITECDHAWAKRDLVLAMLRCEAFLELAEKSHTRYYDIVPRVEALRSRMPQ